MTDLVLNRAIVRQLDEKYPGLKGVLGEGMAVTIDGTIFQVVFLEDVGPDAEVCFLPAIEGG